LRWLNQLQPMGTVLMNEQAIHPVTVSSGTASYPDGEATEKALRAAAAHVYRVPGLQMAQDEGNARVVNVVLLGALSVLLPVQEHVWQQVLQERVPSRFLEMNRRAFAKGHEWLEKRS
jgi:indolepyruvate ferredoxin oxidoreductase beta subunit